jgi:hypothetical protein
MKERSEAGQESPTLHKFEVTFQKTISTWREDYIRPGKKIMMLASIPVGEERQALERKMEEDFINDHRKDRKNLADITYKITGIRAIPQEDITPSN